MKCKIIILTIAIFLSVALSSCKNDNKISKNDAQKTTDTNATVAKEQSVTPFLGDEEITPLFKGRNTIGDWIKNINVGDVEYIFYIEGTTQETRLDIITLSRPNYNVASFYVEENEYAKMRSNNEDGVFKVLPDEIMNLKVIDILYVDFNDMGMDFSVRDIVKGSSVDDAKRAFLYFEREIDTTGVPYQELYNIKDVYPDAKIDTYYEDYWLIGGMDSVYIDQGGFREISYYHTKTFNDENIDFSNYQSHSSISFQIDTDEKVVGLIYVKSYLD